MPLACAMGPADPELILHRFARAEVMHPTYRALAEFSRTVWTIFPCSNLCSGALRHEIQEGLNVVENWNGTNSFVLFGKSGEFASNRIEDQEVSAFALHVFQSSLVYINTRMLQSVLSEPAWQSLMTDGNYRGLSPALMGHLNPKGMSGNDRSVCSTFREPLSRPRATSACPRFVFRIRADMAGARERVMAHSPGSG